MGQNSISAEWRELAEMIRTGNGAAARPRLESLSATRIARADLLVVASLCRRAGIPAKGARLLYSLVKPDGKQPASATANERAEYAICLIKLGAIDEGLAILRTLPADWVPEAVLYEGFGLMASWNYAEAITRFERYLQIEHLTPYERLVARVNLAASLVYERRHEAARLVLHGVIEETSRDGHRLLLGNALELSAIHLLNQGDFGSADRMLDRAAEVLAESGTLGALFVRKWKAIIRLAEAPGDAQALAGLDEIRGLAVQRKHWETARDCDRYRAQLAGDARLLSHVYHGTPSASFRQRMRRESPPQEAWEREYLWQLDESAGSAKVFQLAQAEELTGGSKLRAGKVLHRLLVTLCSDFYRPFSIGGLHQALYPGEVFNPHTSSHRVQAEIGLLRKWFAQNGLPLEIRHEDGHYRLVATAGCAISVPAPDTVSEFAGEDGDLVPLYRLRSHWPKKPFTVRDVSEALDVSARSALRMLERGRQSGRVQRRGRGPATRYLFAD